jgi:signal transduction histidine kinase
LLCVAKDGTRKITNCGYIGTQIVNELSWIILGLVLGIIVMLLLGRLLLRRVEQRARDAERRARDAERLAELGSMTSGLAHEIKNPLSTIGLNAQLLLEAVSDADLDHEERERLLRRLQSLSREVERLGGILGDFLQFAGRVKLDAQGHDLVRIVDELRDFFHPQCDQANVRLRTQFPPEPLVVQVDEAMLKQALLNLMINAVQAMKPKAGDEHVSTARELILRVESDDEEARVHVTDTGPGIEPQQLSEVFRPYVSHRSGGTGLGLPTARRIIEEHGGRLLAHSEVGRGSDFVIHLPRQQP